MAKYSYDDVITVKDILTGAVDKESLIGKMVYCSDSINLVVRYASIDDGKGKLLEVDIDESIVSPFLVDTPSGNKVWWSYIIPEKKKEPEYIPFDLGKEEDRNFLRGKWIKSNDPEFFYEYQITNFNRSEGGIFIKIDDCHETGKTLFNEWSFIDGSVVGKLKEHECEQEK